jgi:hypothetical protein
MTTGIGERRPALNRPRRPAPVRGTIIATAPFSKGTSEAAFATGAAPITLIDGDKLIDLRHQCRHPVSAGVPLRLDDEVGLRC